MARMSRLEIPGQVHWVGLRGNNGQAVFVCEEDYAHALAFARSAQASCPVQILGFCLLPHAMHWLVRPQQTGALSRWVQQLARRFVRSMNQRHGRTGTLFEGRFRSGILQSPSHLLPCMWSLDSEPVRADLVRRAQDWPHSSAAWYAGQGAVLGADYRAHMAAVLRTPEEVWQLGNTPFEREARYAQGLQQAYTPAWMATLQAGWAVGDADFLAQLQQDAGRRVQAAARGRPRKATR
jgi:putative transposase